MTTFTEEFGLNELLPDALAGSVPCVVDRAGIAIITGGPGQCGSAHHAKAIGGLAIDVLAKETGARAVPHAFGTGLLLSASANWAAASDRPLTEYTRAPSPLAQNLAKHEMVFRDGELHLSDSPGLGVSLNEDVVNQYRIA